MGRPKLNVKQISAQVTEESLERLRALFGNRRNQRSAFIRKAIEKALDEAEKPASPP